MFLLGILIFKGLTARRHYRLFGVKGLTVLIFFDGFLNVVHLDHTKLGVTSCCSLVHNTNVSVYINIATVVLQLIFKVATAARWLSLSVLTVSPEVSSYGSKIKLTKKTKMRLTI
jgi:hypothetical protein